MKKDRKLPKGLIVLPESLKGRIVLFHLYSGDDISPMNGNHVLQVSGIESEFVYGRFVASELMNHKTQHNPETRIWRALITSYEILTVRDLPLLIGYKHTTSLLAELIKGEI